MQVPYTTPLADLGLSVKTLRTLERELRVRPSDSEPPTIRRIADYYSIWLDSYTLSHCLCTIPGIGPGSANEIIQALENAGWSVDEILAKAREEVIPPSWEK